jgi:apolipoprotein N-acyltransferase
MAYAPRLLTLPADAPRQSRLICFVAGGLTSLGFEPFGLYFLIPFLLLPNLFVCLTAAPREAAGHCFWYGLGLFLIGTYWIYVSVVGFGQAPLWIALMLSIGLSVIMGFWLFAAGWLISRLTHGEPLQLVAIAPAAWVLIEWLRGWVATGFPWLAFGYANIDSYYAGYAPVAGVYGSSFAVVLTSAAMLAVIMSKGARRWIAVGFAISPWLLGIALTTVEWTKPAGPPVRTTILQSGVSQERKWLPEQRPITMNYYREETRIASDSQLVVWPEVAIPSLLSRESAYVSQLQADARESGQTIVFGILEDQEYRGERLIYNSVVALDGEGEQFYRKQHLVPFGEYFPVPAKVREWMRMMNLPHSDLTPGDTDQKLIETAGGHFLGVAICYEDAYSSELRYALPRANILVNASNDAWFGESIASHQHLQIARMRSLEFGRPGIRSTNTGISAFISHKGELLQSGPQFTEAKLVHDVTPRKGSTPYVRFGNGLVIVFCLLILGFFWIRARL